MGERIAAAATGRVPAHEDRGAERAIEALHHAVRMTAPAAIELRFARETLGEDVPASPVGVFDE